MINQVYDAQITPIEYVMRGNAAIIKCIIPSFVADFVQVNAWVDEDGVEFGSSGDQSQGTKIPRTQLNFPLDPFLKKLLFIYQFKFYTESKQWSTRSTRLK